MYPLNYYYALPSRSTVNNEGQDERRLYPWRMEKNDVSHFPFLFLFGRGGGVGDRGQY